ncbi:serine protease [Nocardia sp. NPDC050413]|uniref:serine protease n=1 Tax=Nocardia sp. NPDC050413 TaxID=3155784 RepID=UPI003411E0CA
MSVDLARVAQVFAPSGIGSRAGSGYVVGERLVLTAAHVCVDAGIRGTVEVRVPGSGWRSAAVVWLDLELDAALVRVAPTERWPVPVSVLRWGRLEGWEPVTVTAVGFPWAQRRPDTIRDTEQVVGFVAPGTGVQSQTLHVNVQSAPPSPRSTTGGAQVSPWSGMSGAGLVAGSHLIGVVVADPAKYGTDRLVAVPITRILAETAFTDALGSRPIPAQVGQQWRLPLSSGGTVVLKPPYKPLPPRFNTRTGLSVLTIPEHGIVPFSGREDVLAELLDWCTTGDAGLGVRTLTGGGGSGKTRLAAQLCALLPSTDLDAGFVELDTRAEMVGGELDRPVVLVVDDADLNGSLIADLVSALAYAGVRVRILLLARSRDPWWSMLRTATESLIDGFDDGEVPLAAVPLAVVTRYDHYRAACDAFAAALAGVLDTATPVAPPDLTATVFGDPLMVHFAALLAVCGEPVEPLPGRTRPTRTQVLRAMLSREARRWIRQANLDARGAGDPEVLLRHCVVTATISAPDCERVAVETLTAVPALTDPSETRLRHGLAQWLQILHEGSAYWNPLRPDPLADQLLADLDILPDITTTLAERALRSGDIATLERLLTELTRAAAASGDNATRALDELLRDKLEQLLDAAVADPDGHLPQRLTTAMWQSPIPAIAADIYRRLPEYSLALADLSHALTHQAVTHYRAHATADPDVFRPDLATSLNTLSNRLANLGPNLGHGKEALAAIREAVTIYRDLAAARPDVFRPDLATSLNTLSNRLANLGQREEALAAAQEAVTIYRDLAAARPDVFRPDLATSLNTLSNRLANLGQREEALAAAQEAVTIYRDLAAARPDVFRPDLAESLFIYAWIVNNLAQNLPDALAAARESVALYRDLYSQYPSRYNDQAVDAGDLLATVLDALGQHDEAAEWRSPEKIVDMASAFREWARPSPWAWCKWLGRR